MSQQVSVRLHFAAGHRILGLDGAGEKCRNPHGHTWIATWTFLQPPGFPPAVEFGQVKAFIREMIREQWDHSFIVHSGDDFLAWLKSNGCKRVVTHGPPTTEVIAKMLGERVQAEFPEVSLLSVNVEEGPENSARWINEALD